MSAPRRARALGLGLLWISPWLLGFGVFMLGPLVASIRYSLSDFTLLEPPVFVGLANFAELLTDAMFWHVARNTLVFALFAAAACTVISVALAILLERPLRAAALARSLVFIPTLVPAVSSCVCWMWMLNGHYGLINRALALIGVHGPDWLGDRQWAMRGLVLMSCWIIGTTFMACSAAVRDVPRALSEAASIDGLSPLGHVRHVTLPMISPAVLFNALMSVIWAVQLFAPPQIMTKGGPENATISLSMYVYQNAFVYGRMGYACALAWVQALVTLALACVVLWIGRRAVYYRGGT